MLHPQDGSAMHTPRQLAIAGAVHRIQADIRRTLRHFGERPDDWLTIYAQCVANVLEALDLPPVLHTPYLRAFAEQVETTLWARHRRDVAARADDDETF